jgi:Flp pilus assembly protein TadD
MVSEEVAVPPRLAAEERGVEALYATGHWLFSEQRAHDAANVFRALALVAPTDERSWLALGACHEALGQPDLALQMYGTGRVIARPSVRCSIAQARVYRAQGRDDEAEAALASAAELADNAADENLLELVVSERRVT